MAETEDDRTDRKRNAIQLQIGRNHQSSTPSRFLKDSTFFSKIVPALLLVMATIMLSCIVIVTGVLLGYTPFREGNAII